MSYAWLGLVLILASIIGKNELQNNNLYLKVIFDLLITVGIAILVATIFSYVAGTASFMEKIRKLLAEIVVSRDFLSNIDSDSKKDAIRAVIKPSEEESKVYTNRENYYETQIEETLAVTKKCVRSNYSFNCHAYYDSSNDVVMVNIHSSYRLYPSISGYEEIKVAFYDFGHAIKPSCKYLNVSSPSGKRISKSNLGFTEEKINGENVLFTIVKLDEFDAEDSHLDVDMCLTEVGREHWHVIAFQALLPTDGFNFSIKCKDPLKIQSVNTFWAGSGLYINDETDHDIFISSTKWMNQGTGLSVVVSTTDKTEQAEKPQDN